MKNFMTSLWRLSDIYILHNRIELDFYSSPIRSHDLLVKLKQFPLDYEVGII